MASIRALLAELNRRVIALEARQLVWRHDAASRPDAGDCVVDPIPSPAVLSAVANLATLVAERGQAVEQVDVYTEDSETCARAFLSDGSDVCVSFATPQNFRARDLRRVLAESFHAV
jgi:hypothetical protein